METTSMNDSGAMVALYSLTRSGKADWNRVILLRTASTFDRQPMGMAAEQSANRENMLPLPVTTITGSGLCSGQPGGEGNPGRTDAGGRESAVIE